MRTFLFTYLLMALPFYLSAQIDDLLKDKDISYLATFETIHDFNLTSNQPNGHFGEARTKLKLLKYMASEDRCMTYFTSNWLGAWILEGMKKGVFKAYDDSDLKTFVGHPVLLSRIKSVDQITTFDPDTYQEQVQTVTSELTIEDIKSFKTKEAIFYNKKEGVFQTRLLAIAPLVNQRDATGKIIGANPIAWLDMSHKETLQLTAQSPEVAWAILLLDVNNALEINGLKVLKNELKTSFPNLIYQEALTNKHLVEPSNGYGCGYSLDKKALESMLSITDTVIVFDPETFEETMTVYSNEYKLAQTQKLVLVQEWYYDPRRNLLSNRLKAIAPMLDKNDENGKLYMRKPLYYLHQ